MPRSKRSYKAAAKKAVATRKKNQAKARRVKASRARERERELSRIEKTLGEEFSSLAEARRALREESSYEPQSLEQYEELYDDFVDYEDQGEFESGVDTGEVR